MRISRSMQFRFRGRLGLGVLAVVCTLALWAGPVGAHSAVRDTDPAPGETVTGVVDAVTVYFLDPAVGVPVITVAEKDGRLLPGLGATELVDPVTAVVRFPALTRSGQYRVDYEFAAADGHPQAGSHQFAFVAAEPREGPSTVQRAVGGVLVLGLAVSLGIVLARRRSVAPEGRKVS